MDNSTKKLLEECSVGCKMGIESMEQVQHHVTDAGIAGVIEKYCSRHKELEAEVSKMFLRAGQPEKEPGVMVSTSPGMAAVRSSLDTTVMVSDLADFCNIFKHSDRIA